MKTSWAFRLAFTGFLVTLKLHAQGTAFTYQGQLQNNGSPANGTYNLAFTLYTTNATGSPVAGPVTNTATVVTNGLFTTLVDFGPGVFAGASNWLEIAVATNGATSFTTLAPRQQVTPAPSALFATTASNVLGTVNASQLSGSIPAAAISGTLATTQLPAGLVTNGASGVNFSGTFSGNGVGVTNVNVNALTMFQNPVVGWGGNFHGETTIPAGLSNVVAIAMGDSHSLALHNNGTVVGWGDNFYGETTIPADLSNVVAIGGGYYYSVALRNNGTIVAWGNNDLGQTNIPAGWSNTVAIAAGAYHGLALQNNGTVLAWGSNDGGQTNIPAGLSNVVAIAAGRHDSLALRSNGTVVAWGDNSIGETSVPAGLSNVVAIAAGAFFNLALQSNGTIVAWGDNSGGQTNVPAGLSNVVAIAAGYVFSLALRSDGTVVGWGQNSEGETNIPPGLNHVLAIAAAEAFGLALQQQQVPATWQQATNLNGGNAALATNVVAGINITNAFITNSIFAGNGAGLTSLNAANLSGNILQASLGTVSAYTPVMGDGTHNFTTTSAASYVKVGNMAYVEIQLVWTAKGSAAPSSPLDISLPFAVGPTSRAVFTVGYVNGISFSHQLVTSTVSGQSNIQLFDLSPGGIPQILNVINCNATGEIQISGWFRWQ